MKKEIKNLLIIFSLLVIGIVAVIYYNLYFQNKSRKIEVPISEITPEKIDENIYQIGNIVIDKNKEEIYFSGKVVQTTGWVQFLIYLDGYSWLENEAAIIANARLKDLQLSLALLDWKYWDEFYYMKRGEEIDFGTEKIELILHWETQNNYKGIKAQDATIIRGVEDDLKLPAFIFLGSPPFDLIVLESGSHTNCLSCPFFSVEEKALRRLFKRKSGESGYEVNSEVMPPLNTEINIIIKKSKIP